MPTIDFSGNTLTVDTVTGNVTGNVTGDITGGVTGAVTATYVQESLTTAVTADTSPAVLTFTGGLNLVSNTNDANDLVHLPTNVAADVGKVIKIYAVEGFELRAADASATLNGVLIGATNEAAFAAGTYAEIKCVADNTWLAIVSVIADGTPTQIVPDSV